MRNPQAGLVPTSTRREPLRACSNAVTVPMRSSIPSAGGDDILTFQRAKRYLHLTLGTEPPE